MLYLCICVICEIFVFPDKLKPLQKLWIVGEGFLRSTFATLQTLKTNSKSVEEKPFIYNYFQITPFYQSSSGSPDGTLHKMLNSIIDGLNKTTIMPDIILLIPDRDIILQANYFQPGIFGVMEMLMEWLDEEIYKVLTSRIEYLQQRVPGSIKENGTKVFWAKMVKRPFIKYHPYPQYNKVVELRHQFNSVLDDIAKARSYADMLEVDFGAQASDFEALGNLTFREKMEFWKHIDKQIKKAITQPDEYQENQLPKSHGSGAGDSKQKYQHYQTSNFYESTQRAKNKSRYRRNLTREFTKDIWGEAGRRSKSGFR